MPSGMQPKTAHKLCMHQHHMLRGSYTCGVKAAPRVAAPLRPRAAMIFCFACVCAASHPVISGMRYGAESLELRAYMQNASLQARRVAVCGEISPCFWMHPAHCDKIAHPASGCGLPAQLASRRLVFGEAVGLSRRE